MTRRAALCLLLVVGLSACSGQGSSDPSGGAATLAVTVDAAGDPQQERAMALAREYAPDGTFTLEQETQTLASTDGESSSSSSTVLVFAVAAQAGAVADRLRDEPHVLEVVLR